MVKVKAPLMSLSASGDLAGTIQFVCGHFVRRKPESNDAGSTSQNEQRQKFLQGAQKWSSELSADVKENWRGFNKAMRQKQECVALIYQMSGYNLWMLYWLEFGESGWVNYPNPPIY